MSHHSLQSVFCVWIKLRPVLLAQTGALWVLMFVLQFSVFHSDRCSRGRNVCLFVYYNMLTRAKSSLYLQAVLLEWLFRSITRIMFVVASYWHVCQCTMWSTDSGLCHKVRAQNVWSCCKVAGPGCGNEASYLAMIGQTLGTLAAYQVTRGHNGETTTQTLMLFLIKKV